MTRSADPFHDLAALFMTESDEPRTGGPTMTAAPVEVLVAGHLPVRGGIWLGPYADSVAREHGPTALIRLDHDQPIVQVFRADSDVRELLEGDDLRAIVQRLAPHVNRWVVRAASATEPRELLMAGADHVTVLSSADDVAVVAAYRVVRELALAVSEDEHPMPRIGVAVIGAPETDAQRMLEGLNRTARSFLAIEVPLVGCLSRIDEEIVMSGEMQVEMSPSPSLREVLEWTAAAPTDPLVAPEATVTVSVPTAPAPAAIPDPPIVETASPPVSSVAVKLPPKPAVTTEPKPPEHVVEPQREGLPVALAEHVEGLETLPVRCPGNERVELARDKQGRLHLLGDHDTIRDMQVVRTWAWAHREILRLACPGIDIPSADRMTCHLFTAEPLAVSDLHGGDVHTYVLAPVRVGEQTGWYSAPLSRPRVL